MILSEKTTLIIGASSNPERASYEAVKSLVTRGVPVIAIGRREYDLGEIKILRGKPEITDKIHTVSLYLNASNQEEFYDYILSLEPKRLIFNPGARNPDLSDLAAINGIEVVEACMLVMLKTGEF
jgi:uncharacterized protein